MNRILCSIAFMAALAAPALPQGIEIDDWYTLSRLSDVQFAPNGNSIAFVVTQADRDEQRHISHIWMVAADGRSEPHQFTAGERGESRPRWSPDGTRLAFSARRNDDERPQIYVMPAAGGEAVRATDLANGVQDFVWSPDGEAFAVTARTGDAPDPNDPLSGVTVIRHARYDQDGRGYLRDQRSHIFVVDSQTGGSRQVTDGEYDDSAPVWSPDGSSIAFVSDRTGMALDGGRNTDVWIVAASGGEARRVSSHEGPDSNPAFSPDGRSIAFSGARTRTEQSDIWIAPVDGGNAFNLTESFDERVGRFVWLDKGIFFTARMRGDVSLFKLDVAARETEIVGGQGGQINSVSFSDAEDWVYIQEGFRNPGDIYITQENARRRSRRVTDFQREFIREHTMARVEEFTYQADDGLDIQGWFVWPVGFEEDRRYPLVLRIHGGPSGMYGTDFVHEVQVMAARGYAMVFVNPRGSSGYGQAFVRANNQDWAGGDYTDVMSGVDTVLERYGWLDPDRMAVYGCSYGGYMTSWIITQTDRFRAAAPECIISNIVTLWGTTDGAYGLEEPFGGTPWESFDLMWERSPIKHARQVTTPALFIQGGADQRTPADQVDQMFRALKRHGVDTEMVVYAGERHGQLTNGKPAHYVDRLERILAWFDKYTGTEPPSN